MAGRAAQATQEKRRLSAHRLIPLTDAGAWQAALSTIPHAPGHTHGYNTSLSHTYPDPIVLYAYDNGTHRAAMPLMLRRWHDTTDIVTPYGFSGMVGTMPDGEWQAFAISQNWVCGYLAMHPFFPSPLKEAMEGNTVYLLPLSDDAALLAGMDSTHRYEIRRDAEAVHLITDKARIAAALPALYSETLKRTGASPVYHFAKETLKGIALADDTVTLAVGDGDIEAVILCPHTPMMGDYFLNASSDVGRKHTRVLLWHAMRALRERGVAHLNLGGGAKSGDALDAFKRRFGGQAAHLPVHHHIYQPDVFERLCKQAGKPSIPGGYFPPYRQP